MISRSQQELWPWCIFYHIVNNCSVDKLNSGVENRSSCSTSVLFLTHTQNQRTVFHHQCGQSRGQSWTTYAICPHLIYNFLWLDVIHQNGSHSLMEWWGLHKGQPLCVGMGMGYLQLTYAVHEFPVASCCTILKSILSFSEEHGSGATELYCSRMAKYSVCTVVVCNMISQMKHKG